MSTGIDIQFVKDTYKKMTDDELIRIATQDAHGLTPESMEIVIDEVKNRGLNNNIIKGVEAQNKTLSIEDVDAYCDVVSTLECSTCGNSDERLNATLTGEVMSFIVFTQYKMRLKVGCPSCLDKANNAALLKTALMGWWGIPWGIINSVRSIALNLKSKRTNHSNDHNEFLRSFALANLGEIETYKNNKEKLLDIIARHNSL